MKSTKAIKGYLIANYTIHDHETYNKYVTAASALNSRFKLNPIIYDSNVQVKEGIPELVVAIAEFPSFADAERFYNSKEYQQALQYRLASTTGTVVLAKGLKV